MKLEGVRILINGRSHEEPGYFVTSHHPLLRSFSAVEEKLDTDFSTTKEILTKYLDTNFPAGRPHRVTFNPADPLLMAAHGIAEAHIEVTVPRSH